MGTLRKKQRGDHAGRRHDRFGKPQVAMNDTMPIAMAAQKAHAKPDCAWTTKLVVGAPFFGADIAVPIGRAKEGLAYPPTRAC